MSDPNTKNNAELWALDVNEVGIDGAKKRWQTKWVNRDYWEGPLVGSPFWDGIPEYRRAPNAPPLPSDDRNAELSGAALHRAIADAMDEGHPVDGEWWRHFDWRPAGGHEWRTAEAPDEVTSSDYAGHGEVRRKPRVRTITANGVDYTFPEPMTEAPAINSAFWLVFDPDPIHSDSSYRATRDADQSKWFEQGRCHATREARDAHERALIAASGGRVSA